MKSLAVFGSKINHKEDTWPPFAATSSSERTISQDVGIGRSFWDPLLDFDVIPFIVPNDDQREAGRESASDVVEVNLWSETGPILSVGLLTLKRDCGQRT